MGLGRLAAAIQAAINLLLCSAPKNAPRNRSPLGRQTESAKGHTWPIGNDEAPLSFLAQIDLATLPSIRGLPLPKTGALLFFGNSGIIVAVRSYGAGWLGSSAWGLCPQTPGV